MIHDTNRNKLIFDDVIKELNSGKKTVVITERKEHIVSLNQYLKQQYETITLSGEDSENSRVLKWKTLKEGNYQVLITTGQFFGEGSDLQNAECLFLVYPFSFKGKLIQYIGRVQRSEVTPVIYDYRDYKIDYLNKLFLKRNTYYRKLEKQASLFDEPITENTRPNKIFTIEDRIKLDFNELEFRFGSIAFNYVVVDTGEMLDFEIENDVIRPEFEVLKPYFLKQLKLRTINIDIHAEFENNKLVSQLAQSKDLQRINNELIESVKFRFIVKNFLSKSDFTSTKKNLLGLEELQNSMSVYDSEEELLEDILKNKDFKHYRHLRYLVKNHAAHFFKIRFVLSPFSFVFLLTGKEQYHIVLETLDTKEATYIWHIDKKKEVLQSHLQDIDKDLNIIRNKGRQSFLDSRPENFSRVHHDYSDERKGFVIWKDNLE